jgi:hypothetical protein
MHSRAEYEIHRKAGLQIRGGVSMTVFVENPVAIAVVGGLLACLAGIVFLARRTGAALLALAVVVAATLALLALERYLVSDREQVQKGVDGVLEAIESNDMAGVLAWVDPSAATIRADVQSLMSEIKVDKARSLGAVEPEINSSVSPPTGAVTLRVFLDGVHGSSGMRVGYFNQRVDLRWVKRGDRWLIDGYTPYYEGQPIDAVGSARGNRPVPGR